MQELLTTPLFLSMFGLVQRQGKFSLSDWRARTTSEYKIEYLLNTYGDATITCELIIDPNQKQRGILSKTYGTKSPPTHEAVQRALVFAAKMLNRESSTELLIEKMQPTALITRQQKKIYQLISGLIAWLSFGLIYGLSFGLIYGLIDGLIFGLIIWLITGLIYGLITGLFYGLINGLISGLINGLKADIQTRIEPNQGIKNSVRNMVMVGSIALVTPLPFKFLLEYFFPTIVGSPFLDTVVASSLTALIWSSFVQAGGKANTLSYASFLLGIATLLDATTFCLTTVPNASYCSALEVAIASCTSCCKTTSPKWI